MLQVKTESRTADIYTPEWRKPVIAVPLAQAFPELGQVREFRSRVCIFNHDRTRLFDIVSDRYQLVQHGQVMDTISDALEEYFGKPATHEVRTVNGGAMISAVFKLPLEQICVKGSTAADVNELTLLVRNSYDRSHTFSATLGAYRFICSNGAKIGETFGSINARHMGDPDKFDILDKLEHMMSRGAAVQNLWASWAETEISYFEARDMLLQEFPEKYIIPVLQPERFPRSKWDLYNDLTRFATHDTSSVQRRLHFDDKISDLFYV